MKDLTWRAWRYKEILCERKFMMMAKDREKEKNEIILCLIRYSLRKETLEKHKWYVHEIM